ncbi:MAG: 16S rRNA (uracil(1498)-N(3))-methyltransferase [Paludibacteraceae bacterium]
MIVFYCPDILHSFTLSEEESQHAVRVLRLQAGDELEVVDGAGGYYLAVVTNPHPKHCEFQIKETITEYGKRDYRLHIAIAPTKNIERLEWFIEKCTEIGVDEITPILCRFSERKIIKPERLEKIIVSAAKQSLKAYFPILNPMCSFRDFIQQTTVSQKFIAHCYEQDKQLLQQVYQKSSDAVILIGPEGDFSPEEVQAAIQHQFQPVSLGSSRLRTETAGIAACHTISLINEK